jgi:bifunctional non-homologous end joining protein LigD
VADRWSTATVTKPGDISRDLPAWKGPLTADLALASRAAPFSAAGWIFELKYDGFRVLAAKNGGNVVLRLRSGRDASAEFHEVAAAVAALPTACALLDGELVVFGEDGRSDFDALRRRALATRGGDWQGTHVTGCFFDLLASDGRDVRQLPLVERKRMLKALLRQQDQLVCVDHVHKRGEQLLAGARKLGLEGIVAKKSDSPYLPGRTGAWRKIKIEDTADFIVIGIAEPTRETFMRPGLVLAVADAHRLRHVGRVAVGHTELHALEPVVRELGRETAPCAGAGRAGVWLEPMLVCEVRYLATSRRGLRHAVFIRFRPDKPWRECQVSTPLRSLPFRVT